MRGNARVRACARACVRVRVRAVVVVPASILSLLRRGARPTRLAAASSRWERFPSSRHSSETRSAAPIRGSEERIMVLMAGGLAGPATGGLREAASRRNAPGGVWVCLACCVTGERFPSVCTSPQNRLTLDTHRPGFKCSEGTHQGRAASTHTSGKLAGPPTQVPDNASKSARLGGARKPR